MNDTERQLAELLRTHTPEPPESIDLPEMAGRIQGDGLFRRRRWVLPATAAAAVVAVVAAGVTVSRLTDGGGSGSPTPVAAGTPSVAGSGATPSPQALAWAKRMVERWESGTGADAFVPIGSWEFQQVGKWTDPMGADRPYALALDTRLIVSRAGLPTQSSTGSIRWDDGRAQAAETLSAKASFDLMLTGGIRCANCPAVMNRDGAKIEPLTVTAAAPATMRVQTDRGPATVPAWRYSFAGTGVQALQAAVRGPSMMPAATSGTGKTGPVTVAVERVTVAPDDRTLTASFTGALGGRDKACGQDYSGYAIQTDRTVGILVVPVPAGLQPDQLVCNAVGADRTVTVRLDQPLKDRVVIETVHGTAVRVDHQ
jgi:hypothetical protein